MKPFSDYWAELVAKNPGFGEPGKVTMTTEEFRRCLERAYLDAQRLTKERDVFSQLFGRTPPR